MKNVKKIKQVLVFFGLFGFAITTVFCQDKVTAEEVIKIYDTNEDGGLSKEEVKENENVFENFEKIDVNEDGILNKEELENFLEA